MMKALKLFARFRYPSECCGKVSYVEVVTGLLCYGRRPLPRVASGALFSRADGTLGLGGLGALGTRFVAFFGFRGVRTFGVGGLLGGKGGW